MGRRGRGKLLSSGIAKSGLSSVLTSTGSAMKKLLAKPVMKEIKSVAAKQKSILQAKKLKAAKRRPAPAARPMKPLPKKKAEAKPRRASQPDPIIPPVINNPLAAAEAPPQVAEAPARTVEAEPPPKIETSPSTDGQPVTVVAPVGFILPPIPDVAKSAPPGPVAPVSELADQIP